MTKRKELPKLDNAAWMDIHDLTDYLRFPSEQAARVMVSRHGIPHIKLGRKLMFNRLAVDRWLAACESRGLEPTLRIAP